MYCIVYYLLFMIYLHNQTLTPIIYYLGYSDPVPMLLGDSRDHGRRPRRPSRAGRACGSFCKTHQAPSTKGRATKTVFCGLNQNGYGCRDANAMTMVLNQGIGTLSTHILNSRNQEPFQYIPTKRRNWSPGPKPR